MQEIELILEQLFQDWDERLWNLRPVSGVPLRRDILRNILARTDKTLNSREQPSRIHAQFIVEADHEAVAKRALPAPNRPGITGVLDGFGSAEPLLELEGRYAAVVVATTIVEVHDRGRPSPLDRVAQQIDDAALRHQAGDAFNGIARQAGVAWADLAGDLPRSAREQ